MKIAFLGDLVIDHEVTVDQEVVHFLAQADRIIANLEGVVIKKGATPDPFKSYGSVIHNDYDAVMRLVERVGITHVDLYNNHMIDYGEKIFYQTLKILTECNIQVLEPMNEWSSGKGNIRLSNSGLAETFGIYELSNQYGLNINDMLFEKNAAEKWTDSIIHTHFGIEMVQGLSEYELQWFDRFSHLKPRLIIRHHPHCIQAPFILNGVPCFPSIGDFAFNYKKKHLSKGLVVIFNTDDSRIEYRSVECSEYNLHFSTNSISLKKEQIPVMLSKSDRDHLRIRYLREYREDAMNTLKKSIKYFLGREKPEHVLSMSSKHFIQPYVMSEIL